MKNYPGSSISRDEEEFNYRMNLARIRSEHGFGRLKGRFRMLQKRSDISYKFMPQVIAACCVLHNIIETNKSTFNPNWMVELQHSSTLYPQPDTITNQRQDLSAEEIRECLKRISSTGDRRQ